MCCYYSFIVFGNKGPQRTGAFSEGIVWSASFRCFSGSENGTVEAACIGESSGAGVVPVIFLVSARDRAWRRDFSNRLWLGLWLEKDLYLAYDRLNVGSCIWQYILYDQAKETYRASICSVSVYYAYRIVSMKKKKVKGFITIEYALLLPVILLLYTVLISVALYWYNQCILQTDVCLLCIESLEKTDSMEKIARIKNKREQLYREKYLGVSDLQTSYLIERNELKITAEGTMPNLLTGIGHFRGAWSLRAESRIKTADSSDTLRLCKQALEKLQNILPEE